MVLKIHGYVAIYSKSFYQFKLKQTMTNSVELEKKKSTLIGYLFKMDM